MSNLIQCEECNGWHSPRAVFCTTCGIAVAGAKRPGSNPGWAIVRAFWTLVFVFVIVGFAIA